MQPHHFAMAGGGGKFGDEEGEGGDEQRVGERKEEDEGKEGGCAGEGK